MESWFCDVCQVQTFDVKARDCHLNGKKHQLALHNTQLLEHREKCGVFITGASIFKPLAIGDVYH